MFSTINSQQLFLEDTLFAQGAVASEFVFLRKIAGRPMASWAIPVQRVKLGEPSKTWPSVCRRPG